MVTKAYFGSCQAGNIYAYTLENHSGMAVTVLTLGAAIQKLLVPAGSETIDVCLGYDDPQSYLTLSGYLGATVGRNCNRIGGASFPLNGQQIRLLPNEKGNQLHGGPVGFSHRLWAAQPGESSVTFSLLSPDGEGGFPGNVQVSVTYSLDEKQGLRIDYRAVPDQDTVINMTNHTYFNLNGSGSILEHTLELSADAYTPVDGELIPTGEIAPVAGTPLDFRTPKALGQDIAQVGLYDHNFCLNGSGLRKVGTLKGGKLTMEVETTCPGMQVYCSRFKDHRTGKGGAAYEGNCFVCMETQAWPDGVNKAGFPDTRIRSGALYQETTVYRFSEN